MFSGVDFISVKASDTARCRLISNPNVGNVVYIENTD